MTKCEKSLIHVNGSSTLPEEPPAKIRMTVTQARNLGNKSLRLWQAIPQISMSQLLFINEGLELSSRIPCTALEKYKPKYWHTQRVQVYTVLNKCKSVNCNNIWV